MILDIIGAVFPLIDKIIPDQEARDKAKAELLAQKNSHEVQMVEKQLSAIVAEANSKDPWTSRARPTFLYVMYIIIGLCFFGGIVGIWHPMETEQAANNITKLLGAIPDDMWWLFGAGYLGYTGARSFDKAKNGGK